MSDDLRTRHQQLLRELFVRVVCPECGRAHSIPRPAFLSGTPVHHKCRNWTHSLEITMSVDGQVAVKVWRRVGEPGVMEKGMALLFGEEDHCNCPNPLPDY